MGGRTEIRSPTLSPLRSREQAQLREVRAVAVGCVQLGSLATHRLTGAAGDDDVVPAEHASPPGYGHVGMPVDDPAVVDCEVADHDISRTFLIFGHLDLLQFDRVTYSIICLIISQISLCYNEPMQNTYILISSILALISPLIYARAIFKGEAKPHRTTRLVLLIITGLTTASLFAQHNNVAIWLAGVSTIQSIIIFALSLKRGMGGYSKSDIICLIIALVGIVLWQVTKNPVIALYFAILADFTGMVPAILKTYKFPETEIYQFFLLDVFAGGFSLLAVKGWALADVSYPIYILIINMFMVLLILRPNFTSKS